MDIGTGILGPASAAASAAAAVVAVAAETRPGPHNNMYKQAGLPTLSPHTLPLLIMQMYTYRIILQEIMNNILENIKTDILFIISIIRLVRGPSENVARQDSIFIHLEGFLRPLKIF